MLQQRLLLRRRLSSARWRTRLLLQRTRLLRPRMVLPLAALLHVAQLLAALPHMAQPLAAQPRTVRTPVALLRMARPQVAQPRTARMLAALHRMAGQAQERHTLRKTMLLQGTPGWRRMDRGRRGCRAGGRRSTLCRAKR